MEQRSATDFHQTPARCAAIEFGITSVYERRVAVQQRQRFVVATAKDVRTYRR
jgi:hypothetical protein